MCKRIASTFKYFRGIIDGNGKTLTVSSDKSTPLFSSIYYSIVRNLKIHNVSGSRGLLIADDATFTVFQNVSLTGSITVDESTGGFLRTGHHVTFENCSIDINTSCNGADTSVEQVSTDPVHFGGFVGVDLGSSKFTNCIVSGKIVSEVGVGGFCASSRNSTFTNCTAVGLKVIAKREAALFVGKGVKAVTFEDCEVQNSSVVASTYLGFMVGRSWDDVIVDNLELAESYINPNVVSSFVGGIAGTAKRIFLKNSELSGAISASFILAGVCPDVEHAEVTNNKLDFTIAASGYQPMMTHVYKLVRTDFLTSSEKEISFMEEGNEININIVELGIEGFVNPFKESIL